MKSLISFPPFEFNAISFACNSPVASSAVDADITIVDIMGF